MSKRQDQINAREQAMVTLREWLQEAQSGLWTRTDYGRGETDYVHLYVVAKGRIVNVTYWAARACDEHGSVAKGWRWGGGQYSKGESAAEATFRAAGLPYSQETDWNEFR